MKTYYTHLYMFSEAATYSYLNNLEQKALVIEVKTSEKNRKINDIIY